MEQSENHILKINSYSKYDTVEKLFKKSQPDSVYYTLLLLSSVIVACGLLLNNSTITIGGMLVTPLLTPILIIGLGIASGVGKAIKTSSILVLKSATITITVSFFISILFGGKADLAAFGIVDSLKLAILYFIVALSSGIAATFAWARKEVVEILPGIAIAVSLLPPLALIGISAGNNFNLHELRLSFFIFLFNLFGVIIGSMIVFSLLKFYQAERAVEKEAQSQEDIKTNL